MNDIDILKFKFEIESLVMQAPGSLVHKHQEADFESELSFQKLKGSQGYLYRWDQKELLDTKKTRK